MCDPGQLRRLLRTGAAATAVAAALFTGPGAATTVAARAPQERELGGAVAAAARADAGV